MTDFSQQERRDINQGIEAAYKELATYTAAIRTHYHTGGGVIGELYEYLHYFTGMLIDLTEVLEEMEQSHDIINQVNAWLDLPRPGDQEMQKRCMEGLKLIREYKIALVKSGLMSLPDKRM